MEELLKRLNPVSDPFHKDRLCYKFVSLDRNDLSILMNDEDFMQLYVNIVIFKKTFTELKKDFGL